MLRSAASVLTKTGEAFLPAVVREVVRVFDARQLVVQQRLVLLAFHIGVRQQVVVFVVIRRSRPHPQIVSV